MVNLIRKYQQSLMVVITILVIAAFALLYNHTKFDQLGADNVVLMYGKPITRTDIDRVGMRYRVALYLGLRNLVSGLSGGGYNTNQAVESFIFNSFVLDHEAKALGIEATKPEIYDAIKQIPAFQTNGAFDPVKYQTDLNTELAELSFDQSKLEDLVRDDIRLKKLSALVGATVDVSPDEFRALYTQNYQKMDVSLVRFKLSDFTATIQPKDDEIKKYYDDHKTAFKTQEKRSIEYVHFELTDAEKKLKDKERVMALQKLADRANDFNQALMEKGSKFDDVAKAQKLEVKTTPEFAENAPPPELASAQAVTAEAFHRTEQDPNSDAIRSGDGFYIIHLAKVAPSRELTLDEAKPKVIEQIKNERGHDAMLAKANEVRAKIAAALKSGKSFSEAAAAAGQKVESFPAFSLAEPAMDKPDAEEIAQKAIELAPGDLSELVQTNDGGLLIHEDKKEPIDEKKYEAEKATQMAMLRSSKRRVIFHEWLALQQKAANIQNASSPRRG